jgi:hypothetical protein
VDPFLCGPQVIEIPGDDDVARISDQMRAAMRGETGSFNPAVILKEDVGARAQLLLDTHLVSEPVPARHSSQNVVAPRCAGFMMGTAHQQPSIASINKRRSDGPFKATLEVQQNSSHGPGKSQETGSPQEGYSRARATPNRYSETVYGYRAPARARCSGKAPEPLKFPGLTMTACVQGDGESRTSLCCCRRLSEQGSPADCGRSTRMELVEE